MTNSPDRIRWLVARTANASRRALVVAGVGAMVVIAALLVFVLVPRRADQQLATALAALPPLRDTVALVAQRAAAQRIADSTAAQRAARRAMAAPIGPAAPDSLPTVVAPGATDTLAGLERQLARARQAPLMESYRALAAGPALGANARARAALDTMEALYREREAQAALGGPDARYAALTARLTAMGQRLETLAEVEVTRRRAARATPVADTMRRAAVDTVAALLQPAPLQVDSLPGDSALALQEAQALAAAARVDTALAAARGLNADLLRRAARLRASAPAPIPPGAMLLASLVLGAAVGFALVLGLEMRRPRVGSTDELAALTHARVLLHRADGRAGPSGAAASTWTQLHYALTPLDDPATRVAVLADRPVLAHEAREALALVARDLTVAEATSVRAVPVGVDVVLVARLGVTPLAWVTGSVRALEQEGRRLRAAVLWQGELPLAG